MPYHFSVQHQKRYSTHVNRSTTLFRKGSRLHSCPFDIPYQRPRYVTQNDLFSLLQFSFIEPKNELSFSTVVRLFASVALSLKRKLMSHRQYPFQRATIRCFVPKILTARYRANECPCLEEGIFLKLLEYIYGVKTVNNFALRFSQGYCILSLGCLMPNEKALFDLYF